tara:strand:+ start:1526 stop:2305 length:780 start_codon:yes stop_codon:yes gene_type:complete
MNYFNSLPDNFTLETFDDKMLLKSNFIDFNNRIENNFLKNPLKLESNIVKAKKNKRNLNEQEIFFYPREKDSLFWCYYISKNGLNEYIINKRKSFSIEHDFKIGVVEKIQNMKDELKMHKIKKLVIEDELVNSNKMGITTLKLFMYLDKKNILIIKNNSYFKVIYDYDNTDIDIKNYYIIFSNNDGFYINKSITNNELKDIIANSFLLENYDKPLKSISSYKLYEIQKIAQLLKINIFSSSGKNKTKQLLYTEILEKII